MKSTVLLLSDFLLIREHFQYKSPSHASFLSPSSLPTLDPEFLEYFISQYLDPLKFLFLLFLHPVIIAGPGNSNITGALYFFFYQQTFGLLLKSPFLPLLPGHFYIYIYSAGNG